jgi:epoxide hydrolase
MGEVHADRLIGIHITMPLVDPEPGDADSDDPRVADAIAASKHYERTDSAYARVQATKPQTLGYGLTDSPAGQAAWILEKFREWTDCGTDRGGHPENAIDRDAMLDTITIYWATASAASAGRIYWESFHRFPRLPVTAPTAVAAFPKEILRVTPEWAARRYHVVRWTDMPRGGHFAGLEQPELLVDDIRAAARAWR